jgi:hypothetical protein
MQLGLEVVDVALGGGQLILSVLQSGAGVIEVIGLEVTTVQLPDVRLKVGILLKKVSVALLNVLDDAVLGLHLTGALLQAEVQVNARCCDLLEQGAHVLGVVCHERPTRMVSQKLRVTNGGHALTPHRIALVLNRE